MHDARSANLLGAAALAVTDVMLSSARSAVEISVSGAAALVVLSTAPGISVTELGRRVGLTQSAAARMVDSLERGELVRRGAGSGRAVTVELLPAGRHAVTRILAARAESLTELLSGLDASERRVLSGLLEKLLTRVYDEVPSADLLCRMCDRASCTNSASCPVGQAERDQRN